MKPTPPAATGTQAPPHFAPRAPHVDMTQREQEKANSQTLNQTGPQGSAEAAAPTPPASRTSPHR